MLIFVWQLVPPDQLHGHRPLGHRVAPELAVLHRSLAWRSTSDAEALRCSAQVRGLMSTMQVPLAFVATAWSRTGLVHTCYRTSLSHPPLAVSGAVPEEPVVSKVSGHLFEKRLVIKIIQV